MKIKIYLLVILGTQILFGCNIFKKLNKEKESKETKQEIEVKTDSLAEVKKEVEIVSTFVSDSVFNTIDLSEETTITRFDSTGNIKEVVKTKKTNVKTNGGVVRNNRTTENKKELSNVDLSKSGKLKVKSVETSNKINREVKKNNNQIWLWVTLGIGFLVFILVGIWKIKKKYFTL